MSIKQQALTFIDAFIKLVEEGSKRTIFVPNEFAIPGPEDKPLCCAFGAACTALGTNMLSPEIQGWLHNDDASYEYNTEHKIFNIVYDHLGQFPYLIRDYWATSELVLLPVSWDEPGLIFHNWLTDKNDNYCGDWDDVLGYLNDLKRAILERDDDDN